MVFFSAQCLAAAVSRMKEDCITRGRVLLYINATLLVVFAAEEAPPTKWLHKGPPASRACEWGFAAWRGPWHKTACCSPAMAAQLVVALLALASLCAAAPSQPDCKELVKPLLLDSHSPVSITSSGGFSTQTWAASVGLTNEWIRSKWRLLYIVQLH